MASWMKGSALIALALSGTAILGYVAYRAVLPEQTATPLAADTATAELAPAGNALGTLPEFTLAALSGEQRSILDWPDRALIINFWATWCAPCLREIPLLREFQAAREDEGVQVVGIAVDRLEPVRAFAADMSFNYPILIGESDAMEAAASFGIDFFALPFTVFTDRDRNVLGVHTGEIHPADLENLAAVLTALHSGTIDLNEARARIAGRI